MSVLWTFILDVSEEEMELVLLSLESSLVDELDADRSKTLRADAKLPGLMLIASFSKALE